MADAKFVIQGGVENEKAENQAQMVAIQAANNPPAGSGWSPISNNSAREGRSMRASQRK